jgi:2,4-dienoyl-CoA reductase (NADPH2)
MFGGRVSFTAGMLTSSGHIANHKSVTQAVHENGGLIAMQILHSGRYDNPFPLVSSLCSAVGRYAYHFNPVSASPIKSPISWYAPKVEQASLFDDLK